MNKSKTVLIVGAGLSGLTAGYRLFKAGYDVRIFEARQRPGGRVSSFKIGSNDEELGGKNILDGGEAKNILNLISEMNLTVKSYERPLTISYEGQEAAAYLKTLFSQMTMENIRDALYKSSQMQHTLDEVIDSTFASYPEICHILKKCMTTFEGETPALLPSSSFESIYHFMNQFYMKRLSWSHVEGGNGKLAQSLSHALTGRVFYNKTLTNAGMEEHKPSLVFNHNEAHQAHMVIFTMPCTVYRDIKFSPELIPTELIKKIQSIPYGINSKILVPIDSIRHSYEFTFLQQANAWLNHNKTIMTLYTGGQNGVHQEDTARDLLEKSLVELGINPGKNANMVLANDAFMSTYDSPVFKSWLEDPFAQGSYSNISLKTEKDFTSFVNIADETFIEMFQPIDNKVYFAGEHTVSQARGTMEGAVESGEKLARLIQKTN